LNGTVCEIIGKSYSSIAGLLFKEAPSSDIVSKLGAAGYQFSFTATRYLPIAWPNLEE